jgi:hypothetical protein
LLFYMPEIFGVLDSYYGYVFINRKSLEVVNKPECAWCRVNNRMKSIHLVVM